MDPVALRQTPPTSLDTDDIESRPIKQHRNSLKAPRSWLGLSPVTFFQLIVIIFSLACIILALVPLSDLDNAGENYELKIYLFAGAGLAFFFALVLNSSELAARHVRSADAGIPPKWFMGLTVFVTLCCAAAAALIATFVGVKLDDKTKTWINHDTDWCRHEVTRKLISCRDGFYGREAHFVVLMVLAIVVMISQVAVCCTLRRRTWNTRRSHRQAMSNS